MDHAQPQPNAAFPVAQRIRAVTHADIWHWLRLGWRDYRAAGWVSPAYGLIFVLGGLVITFGLVWAGMPYLITPMIGGFLLIAPLLALGFYDISARLEAGERPGFWHALTAWRGNSFHILTAGLIWMLVVMIWARLSIVLFALFFPYQSMSLDSFIQQSLTLPGITFALAEMTLGFLFAVTAFMTNLVTLPVMMEQKTDVFAGAILSVAAVIRNPWPMLLWAAVIVALTGFGMVTFYLGLVVTLPLLGHASWHAYRGLIR